MPSPGRPRWAVARPLLRDPGAGGPCAALWAPQLVVGALDALTWKAEVGCNQAPAGDLGAGGLSAALWALQPGCGCRRSPEATAGSAAWPGAAAGGASGLSGQPHLGSCRHLGAVITPLLRSLAGVTSSVRPGPPVQTLEPSRTRLQARRSLLTRVWTVTVKPQSRLGPELLPLQPCPLCPRKCGSWKSRVIGL